MSQAFGNPQLTPATAFEHLADPLSESGRRSTEVDGDVENDPANGGDELSLRVIDLVVKTPQDVTLRMAVIVLHEGGWKAKHSKLALLEHLREEAAFVGEDWGFHHEHVWNPGRTDLHPSAPSSATRRRYSP